MATFPYFDSRPETNGRIGRFPRATEVLDLACRRQVAAWLLQLDTTDGIAVYRYMLELEQRNIMTEPVTGPEIRAYEIARNLIELSERGTDWDDCVTAWTDTLFAPAWRYNFRTGNRDEWIDIPEWTASGDFRVSVVFTAEDSSNNPLLVQGGSGATEFRIKLITNAGSPPNRVSVAVGGIVINSGTNVYTPGEEYRLVLTRSSGNVAVTLENLTLGTLPATIINPTNLTADVSVTRIAASVNGFDEFYGDNLRDVNLNNERLYRIDDGPGVGLLLIKDYLSSDGSTDGTRNNMIDERWEMTESIIDPPEPPSSVDFNVNDFDPNDF